jgi:hypothetical protein
MSFRMLLSEIQVSSLTIIADHEWTYGIQTYKDITCMKSQFMTQNEIRDLSSNAE